MTQNPSVILGSFETSHHYVRPIYLINRSHICVLLHSRPNPNKKNLLLKWKSLQNQAFYHSIIYLPPHKATMSNLISLFLFTSTFTTTLILLLLPQVQETKLQRICSIIWILKGPHCQFKNQQLKVFCKDCFLPIYTALNSIFSPRHY